MAEATQSPPCPIADHIIKIEANQRDIAAIRLEMRMEFADRIELEAVGDRVTRLEAEVIAAPAHRHQTATQLAVLITGVICTVAISAAGVVMHLQAQTTAITRKLNWVGSEQIQQRRAYPLPSPKPPCVPYCRP